MQNQKTDSNIVFFPRPFISLLWIVTKRWKKGKKKGKNSLTEKGEDGNINERWAEEPRGEEIDLWKLNRKRQFRVRNKATQTKKPNARALRKRWANGEFDPGSGWTLAACLIHASRTRSRRACSRWPSGERVSNTWAICPYVVDNGWKRQLIQDEHPEGIFGM